MRGSRPLLPPLLRVLAGGVALLLLVRAVPQAEEARVPGGAATVVLSADDVARMRSAYVAETGLEPTAADEAALVEQAIDDELLFREALARGLDRDGSVRSWLVQQMRALADDAAGDEPPSDEELYERALALGLDRRDVVVRRMLVSKMRLLAARAGEEDVDERDLAAHYARRRDAYRAPERLDLQHVFVRTRPDGDARADATRLLEELRRAPQDPALAARAGDPFPVAGRLAEQSEARLAKLFGAGFARALRDAPLGVWSGPLASAYGWHLVRVERRSEAAPPPLAEVRSRVAEEWRQERRDARLAALLRELRARHVLQVDSAAWRARRDS